MKALEVKAIEGKALVLDSNVSLRFHVNCTNVYSNC